MATASAAETLDVFFLLDAIMLLILCRSPRTVPSVVAINQIVENGGPRGHYLLRIGVSRSLKCGEQYRGTIDIIICVKFTQSPLLLDTKEGLVIALHVSR